MVHPELCYEWDLSQRLQVAVYGVSEGAFATSLPSRVSLHSYAGNTAAKNRLLLDALEQLRRRKTVVARATSELSAGPFADVLREHAHSQAHGIKYPDGVFERGHAEPQGGGQTCSHSQSQSQSHRG